MKGPGFNPQNVRKSKDIKMYDTYCVVYVLMGLAVGGDTRLRDECAVQCSRVRKHERPGSEPFFSSSTAPPTDGASGKPVTVDQIHCPVLYH